jgi:ankyrin repeat protein
MIKEAGKLAAQSGLKDAATVLSQGREVDATDQAGRTALIMAVQRSLVGLVKVLLYLGSNPNLRDRQGMTPLLYAVRGREDIVELLLSAGADPNARDARKSPAIILAMRPPSKYRRVREKTSPDIIKMLLQKGADPNAKDRDGVTALILAAAREYVEIVRLLLAHGADVNAKADYGISAYHIAVGTEVIELLKQARAATRQSWTRPKISDGTQDRLLLEAAKYGDSDLLKILLIDGSRDQPGESALRQEALFPAVESGQPGAVNLLLSAGADPNITRNDGRTPLMATIDSNSRGRDDDRGLSVVKTLLDRGAAINAKDREGVSALARAAAQGNVSVSTFLLERGADPNLRDSHGRNALIYAVDLSSFAELPHVVRALIEAGVDTEAKDAKGRSAVQIAAAGGRADIVALLKGGNGRAIQDSPR